MEEDDQDGCEWVNVSSGTGLPGQSRTKGRTRLCVCTCLLMLKALCLFINDAVYGIKDFLNMQIGDN